jgi:chemotaxis protein MotB
MALAGTRRGRRGETNIWPAFVDAQAQLVMGIIFLLTIFTVAQMLTADQLQGRESALTRLNQQISELNELLALERKSGADLRLDSSRLAADLQASLAARDALTSRVNELTARLQQETARADRAAVQVEDVNKVVAVDRERIEMQLRELESLRRDIVTLRQLRDELEAKVGQLALNERALEGQRAGLEKTLGAAQERSRDLERDLAAAQQRSRELEARVAQLSASEATLQKDLGAVRDRSKELETRLATEQERTLLAQKDIKEREIRLSELQGSLSEEQKLGADARAQIDILNAQIASLREQLGRISKVLEIAEDKGKSDQAQIADLGRRLNLALASKVEELARFRSEFFGRLREVLGDRPDIRVVGDRFVFQSEVLFDQASADLGEPARRQLQPLANAVKELVGKIPADLNWMLRVDGHTDRRPISTPQFPSNWELSTARAISVVKFLIEQGIPADRLAATGFSSNNALDPRDDEVAYRRNRRIELKLTER